MNRTLKIVVGQNYTRRRDKILVVVKEVAGNNVTYATLSKTTQTTHKIMTEAFRMGFRAPTEDEAAKAK